MRLKLIRKFKGPEYTIGDLYIDGEFFCNTLEDVVRELPKECPNTPKNKDCECAGKVYGKTAIQAGIYKVIITMSNRFKKRMPELIGVPHFRGIRIHSGNTAKDTDGCILVGKNNVVGKVTNSLNTYNKLMEILGTDPNNIKIEIE